MPSSYDKSNLKTGARHGAEFIGRLRDSARCVWYAGERVEDLVSHPAFRGGIQTLAQLYDRQWQQPEITLFESPMTSKAIGRSFLTPKSSAELRSVSSALKFWEDHCFGMMGRLPTYLNRASMALAAGALFFAEADKAFATNVVNHFEYLRENDLSMTSTFSNPQYNRSPGAADALSSSLIAHVKKETSAGLIISGCKTLATLPSADELLVYSGTPLRDPEKDAKHAFVLAIPSHTPGIKFICRESVDYGRSHYDHPLGSRFEEMDAVVIFEDVLVPWERVFMYRDIQRCNEAFSRTGASAHMDHQVVVKNIAKLEFYLGLAALLVNSIAAESYQHIYEKLAEIWVALESMKAFLRVAEEDAIVDEWGVLRPAADPLLASFMVFTKSHARIVEIIQQIGASGLVSMPTERDLAGPLAEDIKTYYQSARAEAHDRIPLCRLAWDASISAFASRQVLYERFSRGDPIRVANSLILTRKSQLQKYADRVRHFVKMNRDEAFAPSLSASPPEPSQTSTFAVTN